MHKTDWFHDAKWGVLTHYLENAASAVKSNGTPADAWNRRVESFDVDALANQLADIGAKFYFITLGQNSGHYCAPNAAYDAIVGRSPSLCSRRDLPADLARALQKKNIRLMLYVTAGAPENDALAVEKLHWQRGEHRLAEFQVLWESVLREWSLRYGANVHGWWVDGCFWPKGTYDHPDAPNWNSLRAALTAGNPDALLAFNPGGCHVPVPVNGPEDYTAGELTNDLPIGNWCSPTPEGYVHKPITRFVNHAQYHVLNFLGQWWGAGTPRFPDGLVAGYTQYINTHGGVVTWDVPITPEGKLPDAFIAQLKKLNQ